MSGLYIQRVMRGKRARNYADHAFKADRRLPFKINDAMLTPAMKGKGFAPKIPRATLIGISEMSNTPYREVRQSFVLAVDEQERHHRTAHRANTTSKEAAAASMQAIKKEEQRRHAEEKSYFPSVKQQMEDARDKRIDIARQSGINARQRMINQHRIVKEEPQAQYAY